MAIRAGNVLARTRHQLHDTHLSYCPRTRGNTIHYNVYLAVVNNLVAEIRLQDPTQGQQYNANAPVQSNNGSSHSVQSIGLKRNR